jgi:IS5 family transposase
MKPTKQNNNQERLFSLRLSNQLNSNHPLIQLSKLIDWKFLEDEFSGLFVEKIGQPAKPVRLVVGIMMLQHMYGFSDENIVYRWVENPYWQYFCGYDFLEHRKPIHPTSLIGWRRRLGEVELNKIFGVTIEAATISGAVKKKSLGKVIVDTTVMEKAIEFPIDSKLYFKSIKAIGKLAQEFKITLRQTYKKLSSRALRMRSRYAHACQMKRAKKEEKKLRTYLGRLIRDFERKIEETQLDKESAFLLETIKRIFTQERNDSKKIYSLHEPNVECISKGKSYKKYEFGCKASIVVTHKEGLALDVQAIQGNPYDGHTLEKVLERAESNSCKKIETAYVDKGYRGHAVRDKNVFISGQKKGVTKWIRKQMNRRQAIEPHIGHMKNDGKLGRNYLKGCLGDSINAVLCGIGHNLRIIYNFLFPRRKHCFSG